MGETAKPGGRERRTALLLTGLAVLLGTNACGGSPPRRAAPSSAVSTAASAGGPFNVTLDDLSVSGRCVGTREPGDPVVVLQPGNGGGADDLGGIEQHMKSKAMVCSFGRPGADGNPAPPDLPRSVDAVVADVHRVLEAAGVAPPYFPVGQSAGGAIVFMFAQAYPGEVAGFVDMNGNPPYRTWVREARDLPVSAGLLEGAVADFSGQNPEQIDFRSNETMLTERLPAAMPYAVMYDEDCGGDPECPVEWEARLVQRLAKVGGGGRFVWAKGAGHEIHQTEPQLVYDTVDEVWTEAVG